jgi:anti-sigma regulatory factor (Ser/Thr protein kinase)
VGPAVVIDLQPGDLVALVSDGFYEYFNEAGEAFGDGRVRAVVAAHANGSMKALCDELYAAVKGFAGGAPQEDDMTVVLLKRGEGAARRSFTRSLDSLEAIFAFTAETLEHEGLGAEIRAPVDFVLEELFTNVLKYGNRSEAPVHIEMTRLPTAWRCASSRKMRCPSTPTATPEMDITAPLEERTPGGMGLHLVRKLVDSVEYHYDEASRQGRTTFRKTLAGAEAGGG